MKRNNTLPANAATVTALVLPEQLAEYARNIEKFNHEHNWKNVAAQYVEVVDRLNQR